MLKAIVEYYRRAQESISTKVSIKQIKELKVNHKISRMKDLKKENVVPEIQGIISEINKEFNSLEQGE
jgi:vacuolar-type H+-ATPase catalytic subunit A/Vma1